MRNKNIHMRQKKKRINVKFDVGVGLETMVAYKSKLIRRYFRNACVVFYVCVCFKRRKRICNQFIVWITFIYAPVKTTHSSKIWCWRGFWCNDSVKNLTHTTLFQKNMCCFPRMRVFPKTYTHSLTIHSLKHPQTRQAKQRINVKFDVCVGFEMTVASKR